MTTHECEECGDELRDPRDKDAGGWWRDKCLDCLADVAPSVDKPACESCGARAIGPDVTGTLLCGPCMADAYVRRTNSGDSA